MSGRSGRDSFGVVFDGGGGGFPTPGQKLIDLAGGMIGELGEHMGEPGLGVDFVELAGLDQRKDSGGASPALVGAGEFPYAPSDGDTAQGSHGEVRVKG